MAPPASALAVANRLKLALLAAGVPQVSIELMVGRSGRWVSTGGHGGVSFVANLGHHIASVPSASNPTPGLGVVKYGRPGLPAPLCNGYGGMDLVARIICLDWANHPGEGGPWTVGGYRIPRDVGRPYLFGWEHEGGYSEVVWDATYTNRATGISMTYREFMGRCHAGTLMFLDRPRTSHGEHKTWADLKSRGRKIDRLGYTADRGIAELTPFYGAKPKPTEQEDDMPPYREWSDADKKALKEDIADGILSARVDRYNGKNKVQVRTILGWIYRDGHQLNQSLVSRLLNARVRRHNGKPARLETLLGWLYRDGRDDPALVVENPDGGKNSKPVALAAIWRLLSGKDDPSETVAFAAASAAPVAQIEDDASADVADERDEDAKYSEDDER